jgi:hypothetical protein
MGLGDRSCPQMPKEIKDVYVESQKAKKKDSHIGRQIEAQNE